MLRRYAATNPAEFFAVATEMFFERPGDLSQRHLELFETLVALYNLDPRVEHGAPESEGAMDESASSRLSLMARRWRTD